MKNLFLFGGKTDFGNYFAQHLNKFFNIVEHFETAVVPAQNDFFYKLRSISLNKTEWRNKYYSLLSKYTKNPETFLTRSTNFRRYFSGLDMHIDVILQLSTLFDTTLVLKTVPHAIYTDYTTKMAIDTGSDWAAFDSKESQSRWLELEKKLFASTDLIMTFNNSARLSIINDYDADPGKVVVVGSGSSITNVPVTVKVYGQKRILFCGRDFKRHGGELVLKAFPYVRKEFPDASLLIIGTVVSNAPAGVECIDHLPLEELKKVMAEYPLICMPAAIGGLQSMAEAMAYGCACIALDGNPHIVNLIIDDVTGVLLKKPDEHSVADAIMHLFRNPHILSRLAKSGREHVKKYFTWDGVCKNIHDCIIRIIEEHKSNQGIRK